MSYLTFHLLFILPPIVLLGLTQPSPLAGVGGRRARYALPLISIIAFSYTTPWDNYLVARGVWWYGPGRVLGTLGYVPIEEYLFFLLQPVLTGLFLYQYLARKQPPRRPAGRYVRPVGGAVWIALTALGGGLLLSGWDAGRYLGLILAWTGPVLAGMWLYAGRSLWALREAILGGVLVPTVYLWIADAIAIRLGIWEIASEYTLDLRLLDLPLEEAVFFLLTNLLVVKGTLLFLYDVRRIVPPSEPVGPTRTP